MNVNPSRPPDEQLISDIQAGGARQEMAMRWFLRDMKLRYFVIHHAVAHGGTREEGEELVRMAGALFVRNVVAGKFQGGSSLLTYYASIAKNEWSNQLRSKRKKSNLPLSEYKEADFYHKEEHQTNPWNPERLQLIEEILKSADSEPECEQILMRWLKGYSSEEIETDLKIEKADKRRYHCFLKFREYILHRPHIIEQLSNNI